MDVDGKQMLITGSTRGIGRVLASALSEEGAHVWVHGRKEEDCMRVAEEIGGSWVCADLADNGSVHKIASRLREQTDTLDCLINNAGVEIISNLASLDVISLSRVIQVNLISPIMLMKELVPLLERSSSPSVINMTSIHQEVPYPHNVAYCSSKAGLGMASKVAALDLAARGIRVNNLAPGAIETEINKGVIEEMGREQFEEWIPAGRIGTAEELVGIVLYLSSSSSSYVSGSTLVVDGAYSQNLVRYRP